MNKLVFIMLSCCMFLQMNGQRTPQYEFYSHYDLSFLNQNAKNDADEISRTNIVLMLANIFGLNDKHLVDLHYRVYQLEHTSVIKYDTNDSIPLNFNCKDSIDLGIDVDFGTPLISNNKRFSDSFNLRFASPVAKIAPELFSESVINIKLPHTDSLAYMSSPDICVKNLCRIEGKDVIDNTALVNKSGVLIAAAVKGKNFYSVPDCVKEIGAGAFRGCLLEELVIPETVKSIGLNAFADCPRIKSITIKSEDVCRISESCFSGQTVSHMTIYVPKKAVKSYKKMLPSLKRQIRSF